MSKITHTHKTNQQIPRLLFVVPSIGFFLSHRLPLALGAQKVGISVAVAAPCCDLVYELVDNNIEFFSVRMTRSGIRPTKEILTVVDYWRIIRRFQPDILHLVTAKPILYGAIIGRALHIPTVSAITGLGFVFINTGVKAWFIRNVLKFGYYLGLNSFSNYVIFQNSDDLLKLKTMGVL